MNECRKMKTSTKAHLKEYKNQEAQKHFFLIWPNFSFKQGDRESDIAWNMAFLTFLILLYFHLSYMGLWNPRAKIKMLNQRFFLNLLQWYEYCMSWKLLTAVRSIAMNSIALRW